MNRLRPNVISRQMEKVEGMNWEREGGSWSQNGAKLQMVGIGRGASRQMFPRVHADTT